MSKDYKHIADLLNNDLFVDWVRHPEGEAKNYWNKWMEMNPDKLEDLQEARAILLSIRIKNQKTLSPDNYNAMFKHIWQYKNDREKREVLYYERKLDSYTKRWYAAAVVAAIVTFFSLTHFLHQPAEVAEQQPQIAMEVVAVPQGMKRAVKFPDGSIATLNSGSEVRFPEKFTESVRKVWIKGEAFFEVVENKDMPFIVYSDHLKVEVTGTSFNVKDFEKEGYAALALITGEVKTSPLSNSGQIKTLSPGEGVKFLKKSASLESYEVNIEETLAWKSGIILFKNVSIEEMMRVLEDWYGVTIQLKNRPLERQVKVNGRFDNEILDNVLQSLSYTVMFDYELKGKLVNITFNQ
ncbi:MAG: DUF4974 domain-containing protein [Cyclobacteriaceae bacterium]|nr:DUF4974 domain-containing protein [Cyclobacteriaceae bacterium]